MRNKKQKGFTLIELLVVISIIGLLASIILVALDGARLKARDAKRISDITEIQTALELYYNDNGQYPNICGASSSGQYAPQWPTFQSALSSYLSKLPNDPLNI